MSRTELYLRPGALFGVEDGAIPPSPNPCWLLESPAHSETEDARGQDRRCCCRIDGARRQRLQIVCTVAILVPDNHARVHRVVQVEHRLDRMTIVELENLRNAIVPQPDRFVAAGLALDQDGRVTVPGVPIYG